MNKQDEKLRAARAMVVEDPEILGGTPVIKGTRAPVYDVAASVAAGLPLDRIARAYPASAPNRSGWPHSIPRLIRPPLGPAVGPGGSRLDGCGMARSFVCTKFEGLEKASMSEASAAGLVIAGAPALPRSSRRGRRRARLRDFFSSHIRNRHTRRAYLEGGTPVLGILRRRGLAELAQRWSRSMWRPSSSNN